MPVDRIAAIRCRTSDGYVHRLWEPIALKRRPPTDYAAKFSLPFGIALGLHRGQAGLADFSREAIVDPALLDLAARVDYEIDPDDPYPARFTGHVAVETDDGRIYEARQDHIRGGVDAPLTRADIEAQFMANAAYGGVAEAAARETLGTLGAVLRADDSRAAIAALARA